MQTLIRDQMSDKIIETAERLVTHEGAEGLTVRKILQSLDITNRVFYNRFRNIDEVLEIVYSATIMKVRESIMPPMGDRDFFEYVTDVVANTLLISYDAKMRFGQYVFENDSQSQGNFHWWKGEIARLIDYAKGEHLLKNEIDTDAMSYAIWCFIRGYNADAVGRGLPREEAAERFRYCFGVLLDGMKTKECMER